MFVLTFWSCRKNGLIRKVSLISKLMTSQTGSQTVTIHILPNTHKVKATRQHFCRVIEYNKRNIFLKNHTEKEAGRLALYEKASGLQLSFKIF